MIIIVVVIITILLLPLLLYYNHIIADEFSNSASAVVEEHKADSRKSRKRKQRDDGEDDNASEQDSLLDLLAGLCEFLRQSLSLYMQHVYASHIVRALLQALSAQPVDDLILHGRRQQQHGRSDTQQQQERGHTGF